jgi:ubiquinone biosynthesis protein COQ9
LHAELSTSAKGAGKLRARLALIWPRIPPIYAQRGTAAMLDQTTIRGRILSAALECAASKPWSDVALIDVAEAAKLQLVNVREEFRSKTHIIAGLLRAVDDEVLKRVKRSEGQEKRDALFDVIMTRFDVLAPYKAALKSIYASGPADASLAGPFLSSQHWMLEAAGIGTDGPGGMVRVAGLGLTYASVFRTWLNDDDPGHARTMAALDRRLRRGERTLSGFEQVHGAFSRFGEAMQEMARAATGRRRSRPEADPEPPSP